MKPLLAFTLLAHLSIACGTLPVAAQMPPQPPQPTQTATETPDVIPASYNVNTPSMLVVLGDSSVTWNIRPGPSLDSTPLEIFARGGQVFEKLSSDGVWIQVPEGWICSQAFGMAERCE